MENVICPNCGNDNIANNKYCSRCGHELPKSFAPVVESVPVQEETFTSKINKSKGLVGALLGIFLFVLVALAAKHFLFNTSILEKVKTSAMDTAMEAVAQEVNKQCPLMVDEYTRLDNVESLPDKTLQYNYTLLSIDKSDVSADALRESIEPQLVNTVKTNPEMQVFRVSKATLVYHYRDKNGETILKLSITPDQYE